MGRFRGLAALAGALTPRPPLTLAATRFLVEPPLILTQWFLDSPHLSLVEVGREPLNLVEEGLTDESPIHCLFSAIRP